MSSTGNSTAVAETLAWLDRAVIGLNLCPFARAVRVKGQVRCVVSDARDPEALLGMLCDAQLADAQRHRRWAGALVQMALGEEGNRAVLAGWVAKWQALADAAIDAYGAALPEAPGLDAQARKAVREFHQSIGL